MRPTLPHRPSTSGRRRRHPRRDNTPAGWASLPATTHARWTASCRPACPDRRDRVSVSEFTPIVAVLDRELEELRHRFAVFGVSALDAPGIIKSDMVLSILENLPLNAPGRGPVLMGTGKTTWSGYHKRAVIMDEIRLSSRSQRCQVVHQGPQFSQ